MLLIGALVVAAITAVMAQEHVQRSQRADGGGDAGGQPAQAPKCWSPPAPLPVGTIIDAEALRYQRWPEDAGPARLFHQGQARRPADADRHRRPQRDHRRPADHPGLAGQAGRRGFLAAALGPGMRAVTVPVSATSGVAGFVFPGDRVDLVLTQEVRRRRGPPLKASETVHPQRPRARHRPAHRRAGRGRQDRWSGTSRPSRSRRRRRSPRRSRSRRRSASCRLSLRSIADNNVELQRAIASGEVKVPDGQRSEGREADAARDRQPADRHRPTYTVGAEVSRFQRRTVPAKARVGPAPGAGRRRRSGGAPSRSVQGPVVRIARGNTVDRRSGGSEVR